MRAIVQLPMCDLRVLQTVDTGRLKKPHWPLGQVRSLRNGESQFLRHFGALQDTSCGETGQWSGRAQHVSLARTLRFDEVYMRHVRRLLAQSSLLERNTFGAHQPMVESRCRRFFAAVDSPRAFAQFEFTLSRPRRPLSPAQVAGIVSAVSRIPVRIDGATDPQLLCGGGSSIADAYYRASTRSTYDGVPTRRLIKIGTPLVIIEGDQNELDAVPVDFHRCGTSLASDAYFRQLAGAPPVEAWVLVGPEMATGSRNPSLHLARFHSERCTLVEIWRSHIAREATPSEDGGSTDLASLRRAVLDSTRFLGRDDAFGRDQTELRSALMTELAASGQYWDRLSAFAEDLGSNVGKQVLKVFNKEMHVMGDYVGGDKVGGDRFGDVTDSVFVNRSTVVGPLERLREAGEESLASELASVAQLVDEQGSDEAKELCEALIAEVAGDRRPSLLKSFWNGLVGTLPGVTSLLASAATLAGLVT